jgi:hypothetical protein
MAAGILRPCLAGARFLAALLLTVVLWTAWLALLILLACQAYIASVNVLPVPQFVLREIEDHLAESGVSVTFGQATFDPSGRILLLQAKVRLASFSEPVVTADAIYLRLDPWALLESRFEAREIRATGANLYVPAMLSASGAPEKLIEDLDGGFSITERGDEFSVDYLNCHLGGIAVSAHGTINAGTLKRSQQPAGASIPLAEFLAGNYASLSREFTQVQDQLAGLDHAVVNAVLIPSDTRGAIVRAEIFADGLKLTSPLALEAGELRASSRFPLLGGAPLMTSAVATAESLRIGDKLGATGVRARVRGSLKFDTLAFDPKQLDVTAGVVSADGEFLAAPIARISTDGGGRLKATLEAGLLGRPLSLSGTVDLGAKSADVAFDSSLSPRLLEPISQRTGFDIRRFADLTAPVDVHGTARFGPGWKFEDLRARVDTRSFVAYHVPFDEARGDVFFDGTHLKVSDAYGRSGEDFVYGSYEQDFSTSLYRYLVNGRLRPMHISAWFGGDWWAGVFGNFQFPTQPPDANLEVSGKYSKIRHFSVYGYAEVPDPILKGIVFDRLKTVIFVNEFGANGLTVDLERHGGTAKGSFRLATEPVNGIWTGFDLDADATLDPTPVAKILPDEAAAAINAFTFDTPPALSVQGHFDGPAARGPPHKTLHLVVREPAPLKIHGVPFDRAAFRLELSDDTIDVADIDAGFAGGNVVGSAHVEGPDDDRRLRFKATLAGASLGQAARAAQGYVTTGGPAKPSGTMDTFAKDKSGVRLDLNAAAGGRMGELKSYVGEGSLQIQGAQLGELSLFGGLSKVLRFSELRFSQARSTIKIANASLEFPDLSVRGANSQIRAKGTYSIDRHQLDFTVNVYPFAESGSVLQIFNALSAPISAILRVKLSGSIEDPTWRLAYSPLNLLRFGDAKALGSEKAPAPSPLAAPPAGAD